MTSCFTLARAYACSSRNEVYSTSFFFGKIVDILNNLAQASLVVVGVGYIHIIDSITKLHIVYNFMWATDYGLHMSLRG